MLDIKFVRENPEIVKENIKKKFQEHKLPLVDEAIDIDKKRREVQGEADNIRSERNAKSKQIGALMAQGKKEEAEAVKAEVAAKAEDLKKLEEQERELA
ncbi:MAG: serine--tRNA ligase, partial [Eubacterium sp.]|nr:serine--tRNA ligase [Eubacterium sp.]